MRRYLWIALLGMAACDDKGEGDEGVTPGDDSGDPQVADADGDGSAVGDDCDDSDAAIYPGADEVCDDRDNDCDAAIDEDAIDAATGYADNDSDGYGDDSDAVTACALPDGYADQGADCDDADAAVNPGVAADDCNGKDDDCDGDADEDAVYVTIYPDEDGDGYGLDSGQAEFCGDVPADHAEQGGDCNDEKSTINPGATEATGDGIDQNCDSQETCYLDNDDDGYRPDATATKASVDADCADAGEAVGTDKTSDCNDSDGAVSPAAAEVCSDGVDNDCDGSVDEDLRDWYPDVDGDGFGDSAGAPVSACAAPAGTADNALDCDDADSSIHPKMGETCGDSVDNNCDGLVDENMLTLYPDLDSDGFGDGAEAPTESCTVSGGYASNGEDCDDADSAINPKQLEICDDGIDQDCDGSDTALSCYTTWTGYETLDYAQGVSVAGDRNCVLYFDAAGTASASSCPTCDFTFDVTYTYDASSSKDDGTCAGMTDALGNLWTATRTYTYGYDADYFGAGAGAVLLDYYGSWFYWFEGDFDEPTDTLTYHYGSEDDGYPGYYYTYYQYGNAQLK